MYNLRNKSYFITYIAVLDIFYLIHTATNNGCCLNARSCDCKVGKDLKEN